MHVDIGFFHLHNWGLLYMSQLKKITLDFCLSKNQKGGSYHSKPFVNQSLRKYLVTPVSLTITKNELAYTSRTKFPIVQTLAAFIRILKIAKMI